MRMGKEGSCERTAADRITAFPSCVSFVSASSALSAPSPHPPHPPHPPYPPYPPYSTTCAPFRLTCPTNTSQSTLAFARNALHMAAADSSATG